MRKQAISVTLAVDNLAWLRAQTVRGGARSVSALLDRIVKEARGARGPVRSVVGTISIAPADPELLAADGAVRALFATALRKQPRLGVARRRPRA